MATLETKSAPGLTQRALSGTAWSAISTAGRQMLTVASVMTVARLLGPSAYGIMGMANVVIVFVVNFRDLGTGAAIIQRTSVSDRLLSSLFWANLSLGLLMAGVVCAISPAAGNYFKTPELVPILCMLSLSFFLTSSGIVHSSTLIREMRFRALAAADLTAAAVAYITALSCALAGFGVWSLVFANVASPLTATIGYWIALKWSPSRHFDRAEIRSIARFSLNLSGFGIVNYIARNADNVTVGRVLGRAALGDYQMAYNLMLQPIQNISSVIAQATFPAFARIKDDNQRFRQAYLRSCMLIALITFPVMIGLGVTAEPLILAVLGKRWIGAIRIFQILAPVGLVQSIQTTVGQIYMAKGRTDWMFRWGLAVCGLFVFAFIVGVRHGTVGVAAAYAITYLGVTMIPGFAIPFSLIGLRVPDFARALLPQILITALMAAVCIGWQRLLGALDVENAWVRLLSTVFLGAATYLITILSVKPPVLQELETVLNKSPNRVANIILKLIPGLRVTG